MEYRRGEDSLYERGVENETSTFEVRRLCLGVWGEAILDVSTRDALLLQMLFPFACVSPANAAAFVEAQKTLCVSWPFSSSNLSFVRVS